MQQTAASLLLCFACVPHIRWTAVDALEGQGGALLLLVAAAGASGMMYPACCCMAAQAGNVCMHKLCLFC